MVKKIEKNIALFDTRNDSFIFGELEFKDNDTNTYHIRQHEELEPIEVIVDSSGKGGVIDITDSFDTKSLEGKKSTFELIDNILRESSDFSLKEVLSQETLKEVKEYAAYIDKLALNDPGDSLVYLDALSEKLKDMNYRGEKYASEREADYSSRDEASRDFMKEDDVHASGKSLREAGYDGFREMALREVTEKDLVDKLIEDISKDSSGSWRKGMTLVFGSSGRNYTPFDLIFIPTIVSGIRMWKNTDLNFREAMKIARVKYPPFFVDARHYDEGLKEKRAEINEALARWTTAQKDLANFEKAYGVKDFKTLERAVTNIENDIKDDIDKIESNKRDILENNKRNEKSDKMEKATERMIENLRNELENETDQKEKDRINDKMDSLKTALKDIKDKKVEREEKNKDLEKENKELEKDVKEKRDKVEKMKVPEKNIEKKDKIEKNIEKKDKELKKEFSEKEELKDEKKELVKEKSENEKNIELLKDTQEKKDEKIEDLEKSKDKLEKEKDSIEKKIDNVEKETEDLKKDLEGYKEKGQDAEIEKTNKEIEDRINKNSKRNSELEKVNDKIDKVDKEIDVLKKDDPEKEIDQYEKRNEQIDKEISKKDSDISKIEKNIQKLEKEKEVYERELDGTDAYDSIEARTLGTAVGLKIGDKSRRISYGKEMRDLRDDLIEQTEEIKEIEDNLEAFDSIYEKIEKDGFDDALSEELLDAKTLVSDLDKKIDEAEATLEYLEGKIENNKGRSFVDKQLNRRHEKTYKKVIEKANDLKERLAVALELKDDLEQKEKEMDSKIEVFYEKEIEDNLEKIKDLNERYDDEEMLPSEYEVLVEPLTDKIEEASEKLYEKTGKRISPVIESPLEKLIETKDEKEDNKEKEDNEEKGEDVISQGENDKEEKEEEKNNDDDREYSDEVEEYEDIMGIEKNEETGTLTDEEIREIEDEWENRDREVKNVDEILPDGKVEAMDPNETKQEDVSKDDEERTPEVVLERQEEIEEREDDELTRLRAENEDLKQQIKELRMEEKKDNAEKKLDEKDKELLASAKELFGENVNIDDLKDPEKIDSTLKTKEIQHEADKENVDMNIEKPNSEVFQDKFEAIFQDKNDELIKTKWNVANGETKIESVTLETEISGKNATVEIGLEQIEGRAGSSFFSSKDAWLAEGTFEMTAENILDRINEKSEGITSIEFYDENGDLIDMETISKEDKKDFLVVTAEGLREREESTEDLNEKTQDENNKDIENKEDELTDGNDLVDTKTEDFQDKNDAKEITDLNELKEIENDSKDQSEAEQDKNDRDEIFDEDDFERSI